MKFSSTFPYGLGALVATGVSIEAATLRGNLNNINQQSDASPAPRRRLVDSTTCAKSTLVEVENEDPSIEESYLSCETSSGMQYKVNGVPQHVVRGPHGAAVANGMSKLEFPRGTMIDEKKAEIKMPRGTAVTFKKKSKGKGNAGQGSQSDFSWSGRERNLAVTTKSVLVVRILASGASTSASKDRLSDSVFGNETDPVTLKSQYADCSYGQMNFVKAPDKSGSGASISNGTYTNFYVPNLKYAHFWGRINTLLPSSNIILIPLSSLLACIL